MSKLLRLIGYAWLALVTLLVSIGALGILLHDGILHLLKIFSPFNLWNWALISLLALPAVGILTLANRVDKKKM